MYDRLHCVWVSSKVYHSIVYNKFIENLVKKNNRNPVKENLVTDNSEFKGFRGISIILRNQEDMEIAI